MTGTTYMVELRVREMNRWKVGLASACYYLKVVGVLGDEFVTIAKDIVMAEGEFQFEMTEGIERVEIWNYDRCLKIATIILNNNPIESPFEYACAKHNLDLHLFRASSQKLKRLKSCSDSTQQDSDTQ